MFKTLLNEFCCDDELIVIMLNVIKVRVYSISKLVNDY